MRILGLFNYWVFIFLMMVGFYILISRRNLVKKILGLNIFQTSVFIFYISMGKIIGGTAPILIEGQEEVVYSNPLPHVLILTAIVVGDTAAPDSKSDLYRGRNVGRPRMQGRFADRRRGWQAAPTEWASRAVLLTAVAVG